MSCRTREKQAEDGGIYAGFVEIEPFTVKNNQIHDLSSKFGSYCYTKVLVPLQ